MRMEMLSMNVLMALRMMAMLVRVMTVRFVEGPGENWEEQGVEEEEGGGAAQCSWPRRRSPRRPRRCCRRGCPWSCGEKPGQGQLCASFKLEWRQVVKIFSFCRHQWELNKKSQKSIVCRKQFQISLHPESVSSGLWGSRFAAFFATGGVVTAWSPLIYHFF